MTWSKKINDYNFEDSKTKLNAIVIAHLLFAVIITASGNLIGNPHGVISMIIFLAFLFFLLLYDWSNDSINYSIAIFYLLLLVIEFGYFGIPDSPIDYSQGFKLSKGIMFDIMVVMIPLVYVGLRILLIFPIINLILKKWKLKTDK